MPLRINRPPLRNPDNPKNYFPTGATINYNQTVEDYRNPAIWSVLMDRSWNDAILKLQKILREDLRVPQDQEAYVQAAIPCIVDQKEGRNEIEKDKIYKTQRQFANVFANLIDRVIRYEPAARADAFEWLKEQVDMKKMLWQKYECAKFRAAEGSMSFETKVKNPDASISREKHKELYGQPDCDFKLLKQKTDRKGRQVKTLECSLCHVKIDRID